MRAPGHVSPIRWEPGPPVLVLLCGLSFSGKSTLAAGLAAALPAEIVSLDAINSERGLDGGQGIPVERWAETNGIAHDRVTRLLRSGDVVVDDTGSPRFLRDEWRDLARGSGAAFVLVHVVIDREEQLRRVRENRRAGQRPDVVDAVLDAHRADFEPPDADEHAIVVDGTTTADPGIVESLVIRLRGSSRSEGVPDQIQDV